MINFFRKIRRQLLSENKVSKYLLYAIGEILLVVVGILIALSINNWNEKKKTEKRIISFLIEIRNNLGHDIKKANSYIDNYIIQDSILLDIRNNKVLYKDFQEDQSTIRLIFEHENLSLQTKGYDGLVKNIDNIPDKYSILTNKLNNIYVSNKSSLDKYNDRLQNTVFANLDNLKSKEWYPDYWDWQFSESMINYFKSTEYKNEALHYFNDKNNHATEIIKFKIDAIDAIKEIEKEIVVDHEIQDQINFSLNKPEVLMQLEGNYVILDTLQLSAGVPSEMSFSTDKGQLFYIYEEGKDIPIFWHKNLIFLYYSNGGLWKFRIEKEDELSLVISLMGSEIKYLKKGKKQP